MRRFQKDFSVMILDEIALEGLDGITIEALCKRLTNNRYWPLKPVDDSVKIIVWSFIVCLKNIDFYKLENPRDPLIIYNRFDYVSSDFGSLYEPDNVPQDIYPNYPVEDGSIMGSCKEYFTRFNLGSFPRKITVEEAEKRWGRCLVIVANQEVRTKVLIPEDKLFTLNISVRYYVVLERIGRSRDLGEASFGKHSLRNIYPDSKALSYIRQRLTEGGLIKNQSLAFSGRRSQVANRIVISSLVRFFVQRQSTIDIIVSKIVEYLKLQPNNIAPYEDIKTECNLTVSKTFKLPQLKKFCDTNLMVKYRELYPEASESEYLLKKEPKQEKVIRCIKLKEYVENNDVYEEQLENNEDEIIEGREYKQDWTFERQILRWIEKHGNLGITLSDISRAFRFTTDGSVIRILKKLTKLNYLTKSYCDRGRTKVFSYIANSHCLGYEYDNIEVENLYPSKSLEQNPLENSIVNDSLIDNNDENMENMENMCEEQIPLKDENFEMSSQYLETPNLESDNQHSSNSIVVNIPMTEESVRQFDIDQAITRVMEYEYCKLVYENSKQSVSLTDRFFFRQQIIFSMLSSENIISLLNLKKAIIETEKENPKFIGTLDIKTLIKIIGYFEKLGKLKSVQYRVTYETKTVNQSFVATLSVDFTNPEIVSYMNSFLNRFNNTMKATKAIKKWSLVVYKSPAPKINILDLKLPRFMKMRSLHEYLYYLVYDHPGESLLNTCEEINTTVASYRHDIHGPKSQLPKVYYPTVGWKMFVPPLPKYPKYPNGWFFVSDIIHHMPLDIMLKIVNFNTSKVNLDKLVNYATHPVFKYLPLMTLSSDVRVMLSQGIKKHVQDTLNALRLLCTIGLVQFGHKIYKDTELIFAFLNRRASLLNTVKSSPSYFRISDMDYDQRFYEFFSSYELETYWLDTWYFCTNTPLGFRNPSTINKPKRREIIEKGKIAIEQACAPRSALEAVAQDDGTIPGDNKGAAGFDSHLFSHIARNWSLKKKPSTTRRRTKSILLLQRMKKHSSNRKLNEKKKNLTTSNQLYKLDLKNRRYRWTSMEDEILLFWKLGTMTVKQIKSHAFISYSIKDIMKSIFGKYYRLKSIDNYLRRIRFLMRNPSINAKINTLQKEVKADEKFQKLFKNDIEKQFELHNTKKFKAMRDLIVSNIKQFILFMQERGTTIDMQCIVNKRNKNVTKQIAIKQELDTIGTNQFTVKVPEVEFDYSKSFSNHQDLIQEIDNIFTANKISISVVTSLIHSSLNNQSKDPRISLTYLEAFKQYPDEVLKQSFSAIKDSNVITCSQYHKESLQILLSTSHIIQSKTYEYGPKYFSTLVGDTNVKRYTEAFIAYSDIRADLCGQKTLSLLPTSGLCSILTSLSLENIIDLSVEFDKKYLEYMSDENLEKGSKCLKNTLKRMRSRHFDLLSDTNVSVEYIKIITSVTKQLKNYQVICKPNRSLVNFEKEIDIVSDLIFKHSVFKPQLQCISDGLNPLCVQILEFCKTKEQCGASQRDIQLRFGDLSSSVLGLALSYLIDKSLILKAGIDITAYVHYQFSDLWLVKISNINWSTIGYDNAVIDDEKVLIAPSTSEDSDTMGPPTKRMREECPREVSNTFDTYNLISVRPWTRLDSTINQEILEKFLNSVLSKIIIKPGITLKALKKYYSSILQPIFTRELVEMLTTMNCVRMIHFKNACRATFFSDPSPKSHNLVFSKVEGLEDESTIMLEPTPDCDIRYGYFSKKVSLNENNK